MEDNLLFSIENKPIQTSLSKCLTSLSKLQLEVIAKNHKIQNVSKIKKAELIEYLEKEILQKIVFFFDYQEVTYFLLCLIFSTIQSHEKDLIELKNNYFDDFDDDEFERYIYDIKKDLLSYGFLFHFYNGEEEIFVFPQELAVKIIEYPIENAAKHEDFAFYVKVLTDLYGICPIDFVQDIFNRDFPFIKIQNKNEFIGHITKVASMDSKILFENQTLYHYKVKENNIEKIILERRKDFKPYMPTHIELLEKYCSDCFEENNPCFDELMDYLIHKKITFELAYDFAKSIVIEMKSIIRPNDLFKIVQEHSPYVPKDIDEANEYLAVITNLYNSIHSWYNWGWVPNELSRVARSTQKDLIYTKEKLEEINEKRNNVTPLKLPKNCKIPSKTEILTTKANFAKYWGNNVIEPMWFSIGDVQTKRINPYLSKFKKYVSEIPEESFGQLMDQYLASIWHKNANRGGVFGNQQWNYHVFSIYQQIDDNLFTCIDSDGKPFVLYSESATIHYESDSFTCFSILVDIGGWFMCYGPVLFWRCLYPSDLHFLASKTASQLYLQKGLSEVVQFNPVPFWVSYILSTMPVIGHKNKRITNCFQECRFKDDVIPAIPKSWKFEKAGNISRWIANSDDYLSSYGLYYDEKSKKVLLFAHTENDFYKTRSKFLKNLVINAEEEIVSMAMLSFYMNAFKKEPLLVTYEKKFNE